MKVLPNCFATRISVFAATFALLVCLPAHATTITYNLTDVTASNGDTLTGTVTINTSTDKITIADITFNDAAVGDPVFDKTGHPAAYNQLGQDYISGSSNSSLNYGGQIALYYETANIGTGDLAICILNSMCGTEYNQGSFVQAYVSNGLGGPFYLTGGTLDPVVDSPSTSVVPEPVSLLLLGTGIAGVALLTRLKVKKA